MDHNYMEIRWVNRQWKLNVVGYRHGGRRERDAPSDGRMLPAIKVLWSRRWSVKERGEVYLKALKQKYISEAVVCHCLVLVVSANVWAPLLPLKQTSWFFAGHMNIWNENYISQPPLQAGMAKWLSFGQWDLRQKCCVKLPGLSIAFSPPISAD